MSGSHSITPKTSTPSCMTVFFSFAVDLPSGAIVCLFLSKTDCSAKCCEVEVEVEVEEEQEERRRIVDGKKSVNGFSIRIK
jgi:hypothetical protein